MNSVKEFVIQKINPDSIQLREIQRDQIMMMRGSFQAEFIAGEILQISVTQIEPKRKTNWLHGQILNTKLNPDLPAKSDLEIQALAEGHFYFLHPKSWQKVESKFNKAYSLLQKGKLDRAEDLFFQVLIDVPDYVDAYNHLGVLAFRRKAWQVMLKYYKVAFQICRAKITDDFTGELRWVLPSNQVFYRTVHGYALALIRMEQLNNAVVLCEWLQTLDPSDYLGIGRLLVDLYLKLGQFEKLIQYFTKHGVYHLDYYVLMFAYFQLGKFEKSAECFLRAIRYNPYFCQLLSGRAVEANVNEITVLPQGSYAEALVYFQENQKLWEKATFLLEFVFKLMKIPPIAAYLAQLNQNDTQRIKLSKNKNRDSMVARSSLSDEMIEQVLTRTDLQQIINSTSATDFKLM